MATTTTSEPSTTTKRSTAKRTTTRKPRATASKTSSAATSGSTGYSQGAIIGVAAAGLLAGLAAAVGRKAVVQSVSALSGDWFEALRTEHKLALGIFDKLEVTRDTQTTKRAFLLMQLKHALSKHAFQEENVIYPALRDHDERDEADHLNHDHGYVKQFLYELTMLPKNSSAWLAKLREFRAALEKHVREEEETIFPALQARLSADENSQLTTAMNKEGFKLA
jgi:hemerythrin superfamily protein